MIILSTKKTFETDYKNKEKLSYKYTCKCVSKDNLGRFDRHPGPRPSAPPQRQFIKFGHEGVIMC